MTVGANSYGSALGVAAFVPRYASGSGDSATFTTSTKPTLTQVEGWIDSVSGLCNAMLAEAGFTIPVTDSDVVGSLALFVNEEVASLAEGVNGSGRFGPTSKVLGKRGRFALMLDDVKLFIEANKAGFERLGAARSYSATAGLAFRDTDERGNATSPIFQRAAFGNLFENWDS